jgi:hypothetical protein
MSDQEMWPVVISLVSIVISIASMWNTVDPVKAVRKWSRKFGGKGVKAAARVWLRGQWHRLIRLKPDYRMQDVGSHGRVQKEGGGGVAWGPPMCADPERVRAARSFNEALSQSEFPDGPDWSRLSDEELAEKLNRARIGDGLLAEAGYRQFKRGELREGKEL